MTQASNQGLRILIAGGAGGVGLACARYLAAHRPELILCDLDGTRLTDAAQELEALTRFCDATAEHSVAIFAAEVAEQFSSIDVLINAAGKGYERTLATMRMTRAFLPLLRRSDGRRLLVNIAPADGFSANGLFPYANSPAAFRRVSDAIAHQVRGSGIEVVHMSAGSWRQPAGESMPSEQPATPHDWGNLYVADRVLALVESLRCLKRNDEFTRRTRGAG